MQIVWTRTARRDRASHFEYRASRNPAAALRVEEAIRQAIQALADFPNRGRPGRRDNTRELVIRGYPYVVVYAVGPTRVAILRVLHTSQKWPPSSER